MDAYTTADVLTHTHVRRNQLRGWADARVVVPDVASDVGRGKQRRWSFRNLFEIALVRELALFYVPTAQIRIVLGWLRSLDAPAQQNVELAEAWTRLRSWDVPAQALLFYRPDAPFQLFIGGPGPLPFLNGRQSMLVVDVATIYIELMVATAAKWPAELRRPLDDRVWERIEKRNSELQGDIVRENAGDN